MNVLTLTDVSLLGDYDPKWGQKFWCKTEEAEMPVTFNKKVKFIPLDTRITYESSVEKPDKNGNPYMQLKGVNLEDDTPPERPDVPFTAPKRPAPTFKQAEQEEDRKGQGITAAMAFKLAYHAFIQTEQIQPKDEKQWAWIKEQARQIFWGIREVQESQPDSGSQGTVPPQFPLLTQEAENPQPATGYDKAKAKSQEIKQKAVAANEGEEYPDGYFEEQ